MALINGIKIKVILKGQLIALICGANLKSSLRKTRGYLSKEIPTMFGFSIWTRVPNRQRRFCLERSSEIFAHGESRHQIHVSTAVSNASRAALGRLRPFTNQRLCPFQQVEGCVSLTKWRSRLFDHRGLRSLSKWKNASLRWPRTASLHQLKAASFQ